MHEAEQYLRNPANPARLYVRIDGKRRRLFINRKYEQIGIIVSQQRKRGPIFNSWDSIEKIYYPSPKRPRSPQQINMWFVRKYQKLAAKASFSNIYIRNILNADPSKTLFENSITTGTRIDGQVISLEAIRKWCGEANYQNFKEALKDKRTFDSGRFDFRGYDGRLWIASI